jgi:hypothetical protein
VWFESLLWKDGRQETEGRRQKTGGRRQKTGGRRLITVVEYLATRTAPAKAFVSMNACQAKQRCRGCRAAGGTRNSLAVADVAARYSLDVE